MHQHPDPAASARRLFEHVFGDAAGYIVTFTGRQARFSRSEARPNELADIKQRSFRYLGEADQAAGYLLAEADRGRDAYVAVHLFREPHSRLASNAVPTVRSLWLDEDEGYFPADGPEPTAIVHSSATRRHLYWRLTQAVSVEWAVAMNRRIAAWSGGDAGKAGLATVLRVPGTRNFKRHPQVDVVTLEITCCNGPWEPEVLDQAIPEISEPSPRGETRPYDGPELELEEFLAGVEVIGEVADSLGTKLAIRCPWAHEHSGGDRSGTYVGQRAGGGLWFHCHHKHCQDRGWKEFRLAVRGQVIRITRTASNPKSNERKVNITRG